MGGGQRKVLSFVWKKFKKINYFAATASKLWVLLISSNRNQLRLQLQISISN